MKLTNLTHWRTDQLRAILQRIAETELQPGRRKNLQVEIGYAQRRHGGSSGCAYFRGSWMKVRVQFESFNKIDFAFAAAHEMAHCRGMNHNQMRLDPRYRRIGLRTKEIYAWADALPVERKPRKTKPPKPEDKLALVACMVAKWQTKVKRSTTMLKKWQRKQKYYEKKATLPPPAPAHPSASSSGPAPLPR